MTKEYPLLKRNPLPNIDCEGYFGAVRKYDIHTGIDLYCEEYSYVYVMEDGFILTVDCL